MPRIELSIMNNQIVRIALCLTPLVFSLARADVKLEAEQRENLDIQTAAVTIAQIARTYSATAQVLDAAPLIALLRDLRAAQSAAHASRNELERAEQLHAANANVSSKALEAVRAQSLAEAGRADSLRAQLRTSWGPALATMKDSDREQLVADVLEGRAVLVRAESRETEHATIHAGKVRLVAADESLPAEVLGLAAAGPQVVGRAYLLRVVSTSLQAGQILEVDLQDTQQKIAGVIVPRSAVTRWQGDDWVYIEEEANHFIRKPIHPVLWLDDGCLVQKELEAGQHLVTVGATSLLAVENAPEAKE
jgi:hypothetical protein